MIIDAHAHLVPSTLLEAVRGRAAAFPSVRLIEGGDSLGFSFAGNKATRPVAKPLIDLEARTKWMKKNNIDKMVVGGWLDMFGNELPPEEGERWSRLANEHLLKTCRLHTEFVPLATVPLQSGERAAAVLRDAHMEGVCGAMIGTQPNGVGGVLDDPSLGPFWRTANELGSILFIHPVFESGDNRVNDYGMANALGRITDSLIAVTRIIYSGHVQRYSNVKIVAGIGGAALPYVIGRLRRNYALDKSLGDPDLALRSFYYDTLVHDHRSLRFLADVVGWDRLMMGSDMPFPIGDPEPARVVAEAGFTAEQSESINGGLARKLFKL